MRLFHRPAVAAIVLFAVLISGCTLHREIRVDSQPVGADVYASSRLLGTTPLTTNVDALFPSRGFDFQSSDRQTLVFRKDGYADSLVAVNRWAVPSVVDVTMDRLPNADSPMGAGRSVEARLHELNRIHAQGLMTDQEYDDKKQSLLAEL